MSEVPGNGGDVQSVCEASMNVWQPEIKKRGVFTKISAGLGQ